MAEILSVRGPLRTAGSDAYLFSVILRLTPSELAALQKLPFANEDLGAALMTTDFAPRNVRCLGDQIGIDYVGTGTPEDVANLCKLAVESRLTRP